MSFSTRPGVLHIVASIAGTPPVQAAASESSKLTPGPAPLASEQLGALAQCQTLSLHRAAWQPQPEPKRPHSPSSLRHSSAPLDVPPEQLSVPRVSDPETDDASKAPDTEIGGQPADAVHAARAAAHVPASEPAPQEACAHSVISAREHLDSGAAAPAGAEQALPAAAFGSLLPGGLASPRSLTDTPRSTTDHALAQQPAAAVAMLGARAGSLGSPRADAELNSVLAGSLPYGESRDVEDGTIAPGEEAAELMQVAGEMADREDAASAPGSRPVDVPPAAQGAGTAAADADASPQSSSFFGMLCTMVGGGLSPRSAAAGASPTSVPDKSPARALGTQGSSAAHSAERGRQQGGESRSPPLGLPTGRLVIDAPAVQSADASQHDKEATMHSCDAHNARSRFPVNAADVGSSAAGAGAGGAATTTSAPGELGVAASAAALAPSGSGSTPVHKKIAKMQAAWRASSKHLDSTDAAPADAPLTAKRAVVLEHKGRAEAPAAPAAQSANQSADAAEHPAHSPQAGGAQAPARAATVPSSSERNEPATCLRLRPRLEPSVLDAAGILILNLHVVGDALVTQWRRRSFAVAEPSEAAQAILARVQWPPVPPVGQAARSAQGAARSPHPPLPGTAVASQGAATPQAAAQAGASHADEHAGLHSLFQANGDALEACDGSGVLWTCAFSNSQRMPDRESTRGCTHVHTLYLHEFVPAELAGADELGSCDALAGRLVLCTAQVTQPLREEVLNAGASGVLAPCLTAGKGAAGSSAPAAALCALVHRLQSGLNVREAVQGTSDEMPMQAWGADGEVAVYWAE
jgi:hypothetical protein